MRRACFLVAAALLGPTCAIAQPAGKPARTAWATFMRAGPGHNYGTIDEIDNDEMVGVLGCSRGWCAIRYADATGYIEQDALTLPALPNGREPLGGPQPCFTAPSVGWSRPVPQVFCETKP